jgi:hypothetical protein
MYDPMDDDEWWDRYREHQQKSDPFNTRQLGSIKFFVEQNTTESYKGPDGVRRIAPLFEVEVLEVHGCADWIVETQGVDTWLEEYVRDEETLHEGCTYTVHSIGVSFTPANGACLEEQEWWSYEYLTEEYEWWPYLKHKAAILWWRWVGYRLPLHKLVRST